MPHPLVATRLRSCSRWALCASTTVSGLLLVSATAAQGVPVSAGVLSVGSGLEGSDPGTGALAWQRARGRLTAGVEWWGSENINSAMGVYGLFELERSGSLGAEFRYRGWLDWGLGGYVGPTFIWRPRTLLGLRTGVSYALSLSDSLALVTDLGVAAFPVGSDLPDKDSVLMWLTADLGLRVGF